MAESRRTVTALRSNGPRTRVAIELDGAPWRTVPAEVVVRARLAVGGQLDRAALRLLRRELRRSEALAVAGRALRARDLSEQRLAERLGRAAVAPAARAEALSVLTRTGVVDDTRFAHNRAEALAARGHGDAAVRDDLERQGVDSELVEAALAELEPELDRALRLVANRGTGPRTARFLASKGFDQESIEGALAGDFANDP